MPNIKSAIKRTRTAEAARLRNVALKSAFRSQVKRVESSLGEPDKLPELLRGAISAIDRAAKVGAIRSGAADRRKSRLMRKVAVATGKPAELGSAPKQASAAAKAKPAAKRATKSKSEPAAD